MPETAEIKHMVDRIKKYDNSVLKSITIDDYSKYYHDKHMKELKSILPVKITNIYKIGKRIFIILNNDYFIILNMGMTGEMSNNPNKYTSIIFNTSRGKFYLNDPRKFGTLRFFNDNLEDYINEIGYDPLVHKNMTFEEFYDKYVKNRKSSLSLAEKLLDQKIFGGMGNYLRAEVLYDTRIDPFCIFNNVPKKYWKKLFNSYKKLATDFYKNEPVFKVYTQRHKTGVKHVDLKGRTLWYVPSRIKYFC